MEGIFEPPTRNNDRRLKNETVILRKISRNEAVKAELFKTRRKKQKIMKQVRQTREQLEKRRDEINARLSRVNDDLQIKLDRDPEEQAIQIEQDEVSVAMEENLRKELIDIEDKLLNLKNE